MAPMLNPAWSSPSWIRDPAVKMAHLFPTSGICAVAGDICAIHSLTYAPFNELNGRTVEVWHWKPDTGRFLCRLRDHHTSDYFLQFKPENLRRIAEPAARARQTSGPSNRGRSRSNARAARMGAAASNSAPTSAASAGAGSSASSSSRAPPSREPDVSALAPTEALPLSEDSATAATDDNKYVI